MDARIAVSESDVSHRPVRVRSSLYRPLTERGVWEAERRLGLFAVVYRVMKPGISCSTCLCSRSPRWWWGRGKVRYEHESLHPRSLFFLLLRLSRG